MTTSVDGPYSAHEGIRAIGLRRFAELHGQLHRHLERLLACPPHTRVKTPGVSHLPVPKTAGVYLFTEGGEHRYIGRTKNLNARFGQHARPSSRENAAPFAFNLARRAAEHAGFPITGRTRKDLDADDEFDAQFFTPAKARVREMAFRFVEFDPDAPDADSSSTIFEVYAAMLLGTEGDFNLFATH